MEFFYSRVRRQDACISYKNAIITGNPKLKWFQGGNCQKIGELDGTHRLSIQQPSSDNDTSHTHQKKKKKLQGS